MTGVLVLYADGQVRHNDLDLARDDVVLDLLEATSSTTLDLADLGVRLTFDGLGLGFERPLNLGALLLLYGSGRRPIHPIVGDVLVAGIGPDGESTDVPDDLLDLF